MQRFDVDRYVTVNRRQLLRGLAGCTALILGAGPWPGRIRARPVFRHYPFSLGVASGEPAADGVVLWTRIAPEPFHGGGMPNEAVAVAWEIATDEKMTHVVQKGEAIAAPELGHSVHVEVAGLEPARPYWYRFIVGDEASPVGRTKTLPAPGAPVDRLRFGVCGCQRYEDGLYTAFGHMADEELDFVFHYGDYIYEYRRISPAQRPVVRDMPEPYDEIYTLVDYRNRYAVYKADPLLQAAHQSAPFMVSWDDHEIDNNWVADIDQDGTPPELFLLRRAAAYQAYYENMPLRRRSWPHPDDMRLYRRFAYGDLAEVNVLDTRQYRSDQPCGDGRESRASCPESLEAGRTMLGDAQESWLMDALANSGAAWNVMAQQVMMMRHDRNGDPEVTAYDMDKWDGAVAARDRLLGFIRENGIANPIVLTGDIHSNWAGDLKADFDDPNSATLGCEFVSTSASSGGDGEDQRADTPAVLADNPHMRFFNGQRGYLSLDVTPETWTTHFRVVDYVSRPGAPIRTRKSFAVQAGDPGMSEV